MIKKLIIILMLILLPNCTSLAKIKSTKVEYNYVPYSFNKSDESKFRNNGNIYMDLYEKTQPGIEKTNYLQEAMKNYFLLEKMNNCSIDAKIGLGRVYDEMKLDKLALKHFYEAQNIDNDNTDFNFYFGNYFYKRKDYIHAIKHYKIAYNSPYSKTYELNYKLGISHEKLADIETARKYYVNAQNLYTKNIQLNDKIRLLDELNYNETQYYLFKKEGRSN